MARNYYFPTHLKQCARFTSLGLLLLSAPGFADYAPFDPNSPWLLGDWGGYRSQLKQDGVDFQVNYTMETAANLAGGYRSPTTMRYTDQWAFGTTLDLEKLLNWQDTQFQFTITSRNGQDLTHYINDPRTGGLSSVEEVWGRGQTWRLTQFWLNKGLFNNLLEIKAGRVTVGEDFDSLDSKFENLAFGGGQAGNWRGDRWFNWPVSQWGGRLKLNMSYNTYLQVGFYNQNRNNYDRGNGFYLDGSPTLGNLVPFEIGWQPGFGPDNLQGNYRLGGYYSSVNGDVWHSYDHGNYSDQDHAYGGYLLAQQQLFAMNGDNKRGLTMAVQAIMNDQKTAKIDNYQSVSLVWKGPFDLRPEDEIGFGAARIHVNNDYGRMQRQTNRDNGVSNYNNPTYLPIQKGSEYNYEIYYNIQATNWLSLRPSLQYVASPGAVSQVDDAFIGGINANISF
ncbi:carbohydrate porin [Enterobacteriaceae bacterium LUAb1]